MWDPTPQIRLRMKSNFMKIRETIPSYDIDSLVGEIGGTFSMFLGFCGLNIIRYMSRIKIILHGVNLNLKPFAVIAMSLPFAYWSTQAVHKFIDEPVSTQSTTNVKVDVKSEFPELTFCVHTLFDMNATLDETKYDSVYAAFKHLLERDIRWDFRLGYLHMLEFYDHPFQDVYIMLQGMDSTPQLFTLDKWLVR